MCCFLLFNFQCALCQFYKFKYFVYLSPNNSTSCGCIVFQFAIGFCHFSFSSFNLKNITLYTELSLGNAPFPRVTFLIAEFTDSTAFDVYMHFLISDGNSNNGSKYCINS